jgi:hypothetical protein
MKVTTSAPVGLEGWFPGAGFGYGGTSTMNRSPPRHRTLLDSRDLAAPGWKRAGRKP